MNTPNSNLRPRPNRRQFLAGGLAALGALGATRVMSACGGNDDGVSATTTAAPASSSRTATTAAPTIRLLVADFGPILDRAIEQLRAPFADRTGGAAIELTKVPFPELDRTIRSANTSGQVFDVFMINLPNLRSYVAAGLLAPVTAAFSTEDLDDMFPVLRETATVDGEFYGVGTNESSQAMFYDRSLLSRYGIEPPQSLDDGWTWDDATAAFEEVQAAVRRDRGTDEFWGVYIGQGGGSTELYTYGCLPRSTGSPGSATWRHVSEDGLAVSGYMDTPEAVEGLRYLQSIYNERGLNPQSNASDLFYNDRVAFWLATPFQYGQILSARPDIDLGSTPFPYFETPIVHTQSLGWVLNAEARSPDAATEFIALAGSREGNQVVSTELTSIPIRRSLIEDRPEFTRDPLRIFVDTVERWGAPRPLTPGYSQYEEIWSRMCADVIAGGDPEQLARTAAADIDQQLERHR